MKKILLLSVVALGLAACGPKQTQQPANEGTDSIISVDTVTEQGQGTDTTVITDDTTVVNP